MYLMRDRIPNWDNAPEWANWLVMNLDGSWEWYEIKPDRSPVTSVWESNGGKHEYASGRYFPPWTLQCSPEYRKTGEMIISAKDATILEQIEAGTQALWNLYRELQKTSETDWPSLHEEFSDAMMYLEEADVAFDHIRELLLTKEN